MDYVKNIITTFQAAYNKSKIPAEIRTQLIAKIFEGRSCRIDLIAEKKLQQLGIDFTVTSGHKTWYFEEKQRLKKYGDDIYFDFVSTDTEGQPRQGWIEKVANADYLIYYWQDTREAVVIQCNSLSLAWRTNKADWITSYHIHAVTTDAGETEFTYLGIAVPLDALAKAGVKFVRLTVNHT